MRSHRGRRNGAEHDASLQAALEGRVEGEGAATHTTEISIARRRPAFRKAVAARGGKAGRSTRVTSSSGRRAVRFGPSRKRSIGI